MLLDYNYKDFIKGKLVKTYRIYNNDKEIYITFESESKELQICAIEDGSSNWFEFSQNLHDLINEEITEIEEKSNDDDDDYDDDDDDRTLTYNFSFLCKSGKHIDFIMKNFSNGYYTGWIDIKIIE